MGELLESPQLPSPLLLVDMLVLADMLPTLPELSMLPRDPLMLSQRLRLMLLSSTELTDMVDMVLDMPDTDMELTHMPLDTAYGGYPYAYGAYYGKRSADAEPEADAAYLYGAYGYGGYGLGYARYGYGYPYAYGGYGYPYAYGK